MRFLVVGIVFFAFAPAVAHGASGETYVLIREGDSELASDTATLGESVAVASGIASASGFTEVGVHQASAVGYAWPENQEAFMRSEVSSVWSDLVQLGGGVPGAIATIRAIANIAITTSLNGEVSPKGAGAALDYRFEVRVDGVPTTMGWSGDGVGDPRVDDATFENGELARDFEIPYGETLSIRSFAEPFATENSGITIDAPIGIRFEIPQGATLVSLTPGVTYVTSAPEPSAAAACLAALAALAVRARCR